MEPPYRICLHTTSDFRQTEANTMARMNLSVRYYMASQRLREPLSQRRRRKAHHKMRRLYSELMAERRQAAMR